MPYNLTTCQGINGRFVCPKRAAVQLTPGFLGRVLANLLNSGFFGAYMARNKKARIPQELRSKVFERDNYTCRYCGVRGVSMHADHVYPESKGGETTIDNLVTACKRCNLVKQSRVGVWPGVGSVVHEKHIVTRIKYPTPEDWPAFAVIVFGVLACAPLIANMFSISVPPVLVPASYIVGSFGVLFSIGAISGQSRISK